MGSKCVPVEVRSGVIRDSEEGTEVIVKCSYREQLPARKTVLYYLGYFLSYGGFILFLFFQFQLLLTWQQWFGSWERFPPTFYYSILAIILMLTGGISYRVWKKYAKPVEVEKEKLFSVFFPKVFIANVNDIKSFYSRDSGWNQMSLDEGTDYDPLTWLKIPEAVDIWLDMGWDHIFKANHARGEVWVEGYDEYGEKYLAKFYSPDLCERVERARDEFKQMLFERYRGKLEYLEKVGRYEEAARLYEKLGMLEKAGEMRRKEREATVVHLDLNALIRELAERGFTVTYYCSHCGAPIRVSGETNVEDVKVCSHCGSRIEVIDLARFIKSKLSSLS